MKKQPIKFKLMSETCTSHTGETLYRIQATHDIDIHNVKVGQLGGFVSSTHLDNGMARVGDNAWVRDDAQVSGNARVYGNVWVSGNAKLTGNVLFHKGKCYSLEGIDYDGGKVYRGKEIVFCSNALGKALYE